MNEPLTGKVIALAEGRELEVLAALLERRGARVLRYPLLQIVDAPDPAPVIAWVRRVCAGGCDDLILLTGEGLQRLLAAIERHEPALRAPFIQTLGRIRRITRGPKPARALRALGLSTDLPARPPTSAGIIETLRPFPLRGRRVGLQLFGEEPSRALVEFLEQAGATVDTVAPYRYVDAGPSARVDELLARLHAGEVDAMVFTSRSQVERLFRQAASARVRDALSHAEVAAVGPVVAEALAAHGVAVGAMPEGAYSMKPLAAALAAALQDQEYMRRR